MSDDNDTPESEMEIDGGDAEDLTSLEIDPDELPEGEEVDPDAELDDVDEVAAVVDPDATGETAVDDVVTDDDRLNLDDGEDVEVKKRKPREDVDENEMSGTDDEEADLATILAEKLRSSDGLSSDDDTAPVEVDDPTDGTPLLQPRRPDEEHCQQCFLLVRKSAPKCPVDHDLCPLFPTV